MKKKNIISSTCLAMITAFTFVGCSQEEDYMFESDLSINSQVSLTRSGGEQGILTSSEERNKAYQKYENGCGLTMMVEAWIASRPSGYFKDNNFAENGKMTAQDYQQKLIDEMNKNPSYGWTTQSTSMSIKTLMMLNDRFPKGSKTGANGEREPMKFFSSHKEFSSPNEANDFFANEKNCKSVNGIFLEDENGVGHMAYVKSYSRGQLNFTGYSIFDKNGGYDGGKIRPDGTFQNGWKITGVTLK